MNDRIILKNNFSETTKLILTHRENMVEVEFAALDYIAPEKNEYQYKLEGLSDTWIKTSAKQRLATFMNLRPGKYNLRVKASNSDGQMSDKECSLAIEMRAPWWQTMFFKGFVLFLIIASIFLLYRVRMRTIDFQKRKLEEAVENRTGELRGIIALIREKSNQLFRTGNLLNEKAELLYKGIENQNHAAREIDIALQEVTQHARKNSDNAGVMPTRYQIKHWDRLMI